MDGIYLFHLALYCYWLLGIYYIMYSDSLYYTIAYIIMAHDANWSGACLEPLSLFPRSPVLLVYRSLLMNSFVYIVYYTFKEKRNIYYVIGGIVYRKYLWIFSLLMMGESWQHSWTVRERAYIVCINQPALFTFPVKPCVTKDGVSRPVSNGADEPGTNRLFNKTLVTLSSMYCVTKFSLVVA